MKLEENVYDPTWNFNDPPRPGVSATSAFEAEAEALSSLLSSLGIEHGVFATGYDLGEGEAYDVRWHTKDHTPTIQDFLDERDMVLVDGREFHLD